MEPYFVSINNVINLFMSPRVIAKIDERKQQYPYLPDLSQLVNDLYNINQRGGVPAIVARNRSGDMQLLLYTSAYYLGLYDTEHHGGYSIAFVSPLNLYEHERLSKGTMRICTQGWQFYPEPRAFPQQSNNYWTFIQAEWQKFVLMRQQYTPEVVADDSLSPSAELYLDTLDALIEVTRQLEQEKNALNASIVYRNVVTAQAQRDIPRDIYTFILAETPHIDEKVMLRINGHGLQDLRGRIHAIEGTKLTLKFESLIDRRRIPNQGSLEPVMNLSIYRTQQAAVAKLRSSEAKNMQLLPILAHQQYRSYMPETISQMADEDLQKLTTEQFDAFQRALTVPDLLLVLGPPGTGKTRTITEIARYCGMRHQRVLMTSGTHKAVDNVLERMPEDLIVIRVGHENNISSAMRPKMIDAQAETMQQTIAADVKLRSAAVLRLLARKDEVLGWLQQLTMKRDQLFQLETALKQVTVQQETMRQQLTLPFQQQREALIQIAENIGHKRERRQQLLDRWQGAQASFATRLQMPVLAFVYRLLFRLSRARLNTHQQKMAQIMQLLSDNKQSQITLSEQEKEALQVSFDYQESLHEVRMLTTRTKATWSQALAIARQLQTALSDIEPHQPPLALASSQTLHTYLSWFSDTYQQAERKAQLLTDWQRELEQPSTQFYPELMRYADVVGATCIGAATAKGLEDIEFDLAIVDEAGQIGLHDLLVPLVRARRALLVGDHNQLPPFVDSDVQTWLNNLSPEAQLSMGILDEEQDGSRIRDLLTKSAFEQLFTTNLDPEHIVRFTKQGRMPEVVANFASLHFYQGQLGTFSPERMQHTIDSDPIFLRQFAMIDTSSAPENIRWERKIKGDGSTGESGYTTMVEAILIAEVASIYQQTGRDWVVIVPYRAQARLIIKELRKRIQQHDLSFDERVATVDSFQGGERKKVIYGFTRSNQRGKIGFLKELRRLNVAITRVQQNIVLVGNMSMLVKTEDATFNHIAQHLKQYTMEHGEVFTYTSIRQRLQQVSQERGLTHS